jgi:Na+/proline symporter
MKAMVLQLSFSIFGLFGGPVLGVFLLGIFAPFVNRHGALTGLLTSLLFNLYIGFGAVIAQSRAVSLPLLPVNYLNNSNVCVLDRNATQSVLLTLPHDYNTLTFPESDINGGELSWQYELFSVSYQYYSLIGALVCIIVGVIVSLTTGCNKQGVPKVLLAHMLRTRFGTSEEIVTKVVDDGVNGNAEMSAMIKNND